mmetsp:Transcript_71581/g.144109  ORF Transcript_71581/g.144109 Transcript_71581/m.144109 type:complete len:238 (+) Transcript_71581:25-738(+)
MAAPSPSPSPSPWLTELAGTGRAPVLDGALPPEVDIVIVGAGMTGCSLAYHLQDLCRDELQTRGPGPLEVLVMDARGVSGGASGRNGGIMWPSGEEPFELRTSARLREFCESRGVDGHWVGGGGVSLVDKVNLAGREEDDKGSDGDGGDGDGGEEAEAETEAFLLDGLEALDPVAVLGARPGAFQAVAYKDSRVLSFWPAKVVAGLAEAVTSAAEEAEPVQTDFNGSTPSSSSSSSL